MNLGGFWNGAKNFGMKVWDVAGDDLLNIGLGVGGNWLNGQLNGTPIGPQQGTNGQPNGGLNENRNQPVNTGNNTTTPSRDNAMNTGKRPVSTQSGDSMDGIKKVGLIAGAAYAVKKLFF